MLGLLRSGFDRVRRALDKTRSILGKRLRGILSHPLDEATLDQIEQTLFEADLGSDLVLKYLGDIEAFARKHPEAKEAHFIDMLQEQALALLTSSPIAHGRSAPPDLPKVILIAGVNGSGKSTSVAKLAHAYLEEKKSVLLAAGDTFRAAAVEQLACWADRLGIPLVKGKPRGDAAAVIFDAITAAKARKTDLVICDTAGRLQSKTPLMQELAKIARTCGKAIPDAPHETLLVLDATVGQNCIDQVEMFNACVPLTGLIFTKLDGSPKGGILLATYNQTKIPIRYIGTGEGIDDLSPFDPHTYLEALFG